MSVEDRLGLARALDFVEPGGTRDEQHSVPELPRRLTLRPRRDDRTEERDRLAVRTRRVDDGRADVEADGLHALVVALADPLVELGRVRRVGQSRVEPAVGKYALEQLATEWLLLVVDPVAERCVERPQRLAAVLPLDRDRDAYRTHAIGEPGAVLLRQVGAVLVEHGQAHHVKPNVDRADLLDLEKPSRGDPCPWTPRVEPHIRFDAVFRHCAIPFGKYRSRLRPLPFLRRQLSSWLPHGRCAEPLPPYRERLASRRFGQKGPRGIDMPGWSCSAWPEFAI